MLPIDKRALPELRTQELIERATAGNQTAWDEIFARYREAMEPIIRAKLARYDGTPLDIDDVLQSAFVLAWQRLSSFEYRGEGSLLRWISTVTLNKLKDQRRARSTADDNEAVARKLKADGDSPGATPDVVVEAAEYRLRLLECVSELEEPEQEVLVARLFEELTWNEMTRRLGATESILRHRLQVAFRKLSHRLARLESKQT